MTDHERCEAKIREQAATIERMAASAVDNARRYASDLAAERRAGALRVERIRSAILAGATETVQHLAFGAALCVAEGAELPRDLMPAVCAALLACNEAIREARAEVERLRQVAREMVAS